MHVSDRKLVFHADVCAYLKRATESSSSLRPRALVFQRFKRRPEGMGDNNTAFERSYALAS
jgi:hypothetical protein